MNPVYNLGISAYAAAVRLVKGRNRKARLMLEGQAETLGRIRAAREGDDSEWIWIHAASLGEFEQGRPLIELIKSECPELKVLLTFFSPSGFEVRKNYELADCVAYLPFDKPRKVRAFLDAARPSKAIFVKYEFWGNYLSELHRRGIPTYLISAIFRPSQSFFQWWGGTFRGMLKNYTKFYVQNDDSKRLLASLGVENVEVTGDTRLDRVYDIMERAEPIPAVEVFKAGSEDPILIAGSTWPADEAILFPWLAKNPDVRSIIAPHEFDADRLAAMVKALGDRAVLLSEYERDPKACPDARHLVVDSFGRLASIYRYGTIAYVGGGHGVGIHNINEAAVYGLPVGFGPNHHKFKEAADLIKLGGGFEIASVADFERTLGRLLSDPEARARSGRASADYISRNRGATRRIYDELFRRR